MSEASYTAWDDNLYEWPPPAGWYQASDGKWWPEGYGPPVPADASTETIDERPTHDREPSTNAGGSQQPFQPERTAMFPAGSPVVGSGGDDGSRAQLSSAEERAKAESQRPVYDELPPIDDVFGGVDPYATPSPMEVEPPEPVPSEPEPSPAAPAGHAGYRPSPPDAVADHDDSRDDRQDHRHEPAGNDRAAGTGTGSGLGEQTVADAGFARSEAGFGRSDSGEAASLPQEPAGSPSIFEAPFYDRGPSPGHPDDLRSLAADHDDHGSLAADHDDHRSLAADHDDHRSLAADHDDPPPAGQPGQFQPAQSSPYDATGPVPGAVSAEPPRAYGEVGTQTLAPAYDREGVPDPNAYSSPGRPAEPEPSGGGGGWLLLLIGGAFLVLVVAVAAGILLLRDDGSESDGTSSSDASSSATTSGPGTFDDPYPFGTPVVVFYEDEAASEQLRWVIQLLEPVADQTDDLVGGGATPPADGEVLAQTRVRVTFQSGPAPGQLSDLRLNSVGPSRTTFDQAGNACPATAEGLNLAASLQPGEAVEGDLCWQVPAGELAELKLAVEAGPAEGTVHLALQ